VARHYAEPMTLKQGASLTKMSMPQFRKLFKKIAGMTFVRYLTLVRLAQPFSLRYPLVDGQGNFGSVDGDPPAAMRYTEAKLALIAEELLRDIEKDTVDFEDNYDGEMKEPKKVLPARLPNLLLNGSTGIAVGMATNIPPHNANELCDVLMYLIDNPECALTELIERLPGPDFPTGGIILGREGIKQAYSTGNGRVAEPHTLRGAFAPRSGYTGSTARGRHQRLRSPTRASHRNLPGRSYRSGAEAGLYRGVIFARRSDPPSAHVRERNRSLG